MQADINYIFNHSTIAFFHVFLSSFVWHFILPVTSLTILFFPYYITFSLISIFHVDFFLVGYSFHFNLSSVSAIVVLFCRKCRCNSFFLVLLSFSSFFFFIAILNVVIQHHCWTLYSLFCRSFSCFHQLPGISCTDW